MIYFILAVLSATFAFYFLYRRGQEKMKTSKYIEEVDIVFPAVGIAFAVGVLWPAALPIFAVYIYLNRNNQ